MKPSHLGNLLALFAVLILAVAAFAGVPQTINYQGYLKNTAGVPVHNTSVNVTFRLYSSGSGVNPLWSGTEQSVTPSNGIYSTQIGPTSLPFDRRYYLGVTVDAEPELRPLQQLDAVPYALNAASSETSTAIAGQTLTQLDSRYISPTEPRATPQQLATLRWDQVNTGGSSTTVGTNPLALVFDGGSIWVANYTSNNVMKIKPASGTVLGTYTAGTNPIALAFDGSSIWVANYTSNNIQRISPDTGAVLGTYSVGVRPYALAFDGSSMWVANYGSNNVMKINPANGAVLGTYAVGASPVALAFDGSSIWVANSNGNSVTKLNSTSGAFVGTYPVGSNPFALTYDGSSIWVANNTGNNVMKIDPASGALLGTYAVGINPQALAFDGGAIWVANFNNGIVMRLDPANGSVLGAVATGSGPRALAFDGSSTWVANSNSNSVYRILHAGLVLGPATVGALQLATNSVDAFNIIDGAVGTQKIADSSITTAKIASGAVTDAQISGVISAAKLDLSGVQKKYAKVAVVAQSGGDYTSPVTAMSAVNIWCAPAPSVNNPCLLKIMPGVYNLAGGTLVMQEYVDIEGSGELATTITSALAGSSNGTVNGASNAEIRSLTIRNTGTGGASTHVVGMHNAAASTRMTNLTVSASGGTFGYGVDNRSGSASIMTNVTVTSSGTQTTYGVLNENSSPIMNNVISNVSGGSGGNYAIYNSASSPSLYELTATATGGNESYGVYNLSSSPVMNHVSASASGGLSNNYGVLNITNSSPAMTNVTSSSSGAGAINYGVYNISSSSPVMKTVSAIASGGLSSYGVFNSISSSPQMTAVLSKAFGASNNNIGIYNSSSFVPSMIDVIASGSGGTSSYGMINAATSGSYTMNIDRSSFEGTTNSILNDTEFTIRIGSTKLIGPKNALGTYIYSGSYDDAGTLTAAAFSGNGAGLTNITAANVSGMVAVANGGTGAATAPTALTNLGAVAKAGDTMTGTLNLPANGLTVGTNQLVVVGGEVGIGTASPNEQLEITGNLRLPATTATTGIIKRGANSLIHTYGGNSFFAGEGAGNFTMTGLGGNIGIGLAVLNSNTTGYYNTAIGINALYPNQDGSRNTATGYFSLRNNTSGSDNVASGAYSLHSNTSGISNVAIGNEALLLNTTGSASTAVGRFALRSQAYTNSGTTWPTYNTAVGFESLYSNAPTSTLSGVVNTAIGAEALRGNTIGSANTAVGSFAGTTDNSSYANTTGSLNSFFGAYSGPGTATQLNNATAIGYNAKVSQSNSLVLGGTGADAVKVGIGTTAPGTYLDVTNSMRVTGVPIPTWATTGQGLEMAYDSDNMRGFIQAYNRNTSAFESLDINASAVNIGGGGSLTVASIPSASSSYTLCSSAVNSGRIERCSSTRKLKGNIVDIPLGLETVKALRPVTFTWNANGLEDIGFIAEEVSQVQPVLAIYNEQGEPDGVKYANISAVLVKAVQEQQVIIEQLKNELAELKKLINR
ncbi:MAG: tail fiber domain-containing protein [Geobacteraceae bacterium]|nr:tail fiber domain-containing protein [Geobacteraceae bacterium]